MGNDQSRAGASSSNGQDDVVLDYYELLQVSEEATEEEIKVRWIHFRLSASG